MTVDYQRPDPDALLQTLQDEEQDGGKRGLLKIFCGRAAGVGKTYAMLEAAGRISREGVDIVIGYIETHGRIETEELLKGLEARPREKVEYRGMVVE